VPSRSLRALKDDIALVKRQELVLPGECACKSYECVNERAAVDLLSKRLRQNLTDIPMYSTNVCIEG
jgi:hypothetical protein